MTWFWKDLHGYRLLGAVGAFLLLMGGICHSETSQLWGTSGDRWTPTSRLPDFSHAGYHSGQDPIPDLAVVKNVMDFGARGDGRSDDTRAFRDAIDAARDGAVFIPPGRYRITGMLKIQKSHLVLRGAGRDKTILFFPKSLTQVVGDGKKYAPGRSWSWSGGFLFFQGQNHGGFLTSISSAALRGDSAVTVTSNTLLSEGQWVRVVMTNTGGSLARHLLADRFAGPADLVGGCLIDFPVILESIQEHAVRFNRPLRCDIQLNWTPAIYADSPTVQEVGVEDLTLQFPALPEAPHHQEPGFNAIEFSHVTNGWVRRIRVVNCDSGIFLRDRTTFCTVQSVEFDADSAKYRVGYGGRGENSTLVVGGHHGLVAAGLSQDNLFTDFQINLRFIHDTSVADGAAGNVFSQGKAIDMDFDHHRRVPYENLFTQIDGGEGTRLWESGGDEADGPHSGVRETFWGIHTQEPQSLPPWALETNIVGLTTTLSNQQDDPNLWLEAIPPDHLDPPNLYTAQVQATQTPK